MDLFWKMTAAILLSVVLSLSLGKQEKDFSILLNMAVSCMCAMVAFSYLEPIFDFFRELETTGNLSSHLVTVLLKAVGIGLVTELAGLICTDAGCSSLGKCLQIMGSSAILYISLPIFQSLLNLVKDVLGEL